MNKKTYREKARIAKSKHYFEAGLEYLIEDNFQDSENFHAVVDVRLYGDDDPHIREQKSGKLPTVANIYYKGEYVCEVNEKMNPKAVIDRIVFALSLKPELTVQRGDGFLDISKL